MSITTERRERAFREAVSVKQFIEQAEVNKQTLVSNFDAYQLSEQDLAFFTGLEEPIDVLVLAHDWCGDVVANLPLFGKIEQETGKLKVRVLNRDPDNTDIAAAYPHSDSRSHIPTYVFFNRAGEELGVFIERPDSITELLNEWKETFWNEHPEYDGRGKAISALDDEAKKGLLRYLKQQRSQVLETEKAAILREIQSIVAGEIRPFREVGAGHFVACHDPAW